jgi:uncharacterized protein
MNASYWIQTLGLQRHPEGGHFREVYRSSESLRGKALPERFNGDRSLGTAIYYLLEGHAFSAFHQLKQDEIFHFYDGNPAIVYTLQAQGLVVYRLGRDPRKGQLPMLVLPSGTVFAVELEGHHGFALMGCTVSPGFDFQDLDIVSRDDLVRQFPEHYELVQRLSLQ